MQDKCITDVCSPKFGPYLWWHTTIVYLPNTTAYSIKCTTDVCQINNWTHNIKFNKLIIIPLYYINNNNNIIYYNISFGYFNSLLIIIFEYCLTFRFIYRQFFNIILFRLMDSCLRWLRKFFKNYFIVWLRSTNPQT